MLLALATSNKIWLSVFAGVFIAFALIASLVVPRWRPDFPGERGRNWFVLTTIALFAAMIFAVTVFAREEEEPHAQKAGEIVKEEPGGGEPQPPKTTAGATQGDPTAGKGLFGSQGCGGCHALAAAGTQATVGPNLDESLEGKDAEYVRQAIVDPNAEVAEGFQPGIMPGNYGEQLSPKQLADLVAFLGQP